MSVCYLEGVLCVSRGCLESFCTVSVEYLDGVGIVLGACLKVSGDCLLWRKLCVMCFSCEGLEFVW